SCPCGYAINATDSEHRATFTEALESDFLHTSNLTTDVVWIPQAYNVTPLAARGPCGKASQIENVIPNPIANPYDWTGEGTHGGDPGMQLWVKHDLIPSPSNSSQSIVPMSEIVSARTDILYGTFRIAVKTTAISGTCAAFFFYLSDSREIDMEFLSKQQQPARPGHSSSPAGGAVNLVLQSPQSAEVGYVDPSSPDFALQDLAFKPQEGYHEYRFDWLPDRVEFYADGTVLQTMRENVPSQAGAVHLSHWSNGNAGWSGGPPREDAVMVVSYVKAYFNSSIDGVGEKSLGECGQGEEVCQVPDQRTAPELSGMEGNRTGHTMFFGNE
ncbi:glycoside hydrolase family 16 protein, partial [Dothistroma septosporum NZE10]